VELVDPPVVDAADEQARGVRPQIDGGDDHL